MTENIPMFAIGDKVRIMQTDEMVSRNLANVKFQIMAFEMFGQVTYASGWRRDGKFVSVPTHSLMKVF